MKISFSVMYLPSFTALALLVSNYANITFPLKFRHCYIINNIGVRLNHSTFECLSRWMESSGSSSHSDTDSSNASVSKSHGDKRNDVGDILDDISTEFVGQNTPVRYYRSSTKSSEPNDLSDKEAGQIDYERIYNDMELPLSKYIDRNIKTLKAESNITELKPSQIVDYAEAIDLTEACKPKDYSDILYKLLDAPEIAPKLSESSNENLYKKCSDMVAEQDSKGFRFPFGGTVYDMYTRDSVIKSWGKTNIEARSPVDKTRPSVGYGYYIHQDRSLADKLSANQYYEDTQGLKDQVQKLRSIRFEKSLDNYTILPGTNTEKVLVSHSKSLNDVIIKANKLASETQDIDEDLSWINPYNPWDELIHLKHNSTIFTGKTAKSFDQHFFNEYRASFLINDEINNHVETLRSSVYIEDVLQYYGETDEETAKKNPFKSEQVPWDPDEMPFDRLFALIYPPHNKGPMKKFKLRFPRKSTELDADLKQNRREDLPWVLSSSFYDNKLDEEYSGVKRGKICHSDELGEAEGMDLPSVTNASESLQKFVDRVAMVPDFNPEILKYRQSLQLATEALGASRKCMGYSYAGDIFRDQRFATILDILTKALALEYTRISNNISLDDIQKDGSGEKLLELNADYLGKLLNILSAWQVKGGDFIYEFAAFLLLHLARTSTISQISKIAVPVFNRLTLTTNVKKKWLIMLLDIVESRLSEYVIQNLPIGKISNDCCNHYENLKQFLPLLQMCYEYRVSYVGFVKKLSMLFSDEITKFFTAIKSDTEYSQFFTLSLALIETTKDFDELICKSMKQIEYDGISARNALLAFKVLRDKGSMGEIISKFKGIILEKKYQLSPSEILDLIGILRERRDELGIDGLLIFNLLDNFRSIFNPSYDQLFQAFEHLVFFRKYMSKRHVNLVAEEFLRDSADYSLISHVGLNAEYLGYPFFVTARLLKYSSLCGYTDHKVL